MAATDGSTHVVAGSRPWNRPAFDRFRATRPPGEHWEFVAAPGELEPRLRAVDPRYVFFLHWSSIVPARVTDRWECVCFHMTDVPYGRGGSPLQNLILRGHRETVLTALRMTDEVDAGPVYDKRPLSLAGTAQAVYERATELSLAMAAGIVDAQPEPVPQEGPVTRFARRTPAESRLPSEGTVDDLYDFIRMLDADGYPRAFVEHGGVRLELGDARRVDGHLEARVMLTVPGDGAAP